MGGLGGEQKEREKTANGTCEASLCHKPGDRFTLVCVCVWEGARAWLTFALLQQGGDDGFVLDGVEGDRKSVV